LKSTNSTLHPDPINLSSTRKKTAIELPARAPEGRHPLSSSEDARACACAHRDGKEAALFFWCSKHPAGPGPSSLGRHTQHERLGSPHPGRTLPYRPISPREGLP
jgi:hypothetical protein